jgi:hypothetical protein
MQKQSQILLLKNEEIDKDLWDECIKTSSNQLIYARSFYLDRMSSGWRALISEKYDWVLPVTERTKYWITYLYQPSFTQQLGVFAKPDVVIPYKGIINILETYSRFWEISWNYAAPKDLFNAPLQFTEATNYILDLSAGYNDIAARYHKGLVNNLKLASKGEHIYRDSKDYNTSIQLYKAYYAGRMPMVKPIDYERFKQVCQHLAEQEMIVCREVVNSNEEVMASALLLRDDLRLYNIMNTTTEAGRKSQANHFLLDRIIQEFSGKELLFDFEGSDLPGVKSFYQNFGAVNQPFFRIKYNNLPWPINLLKK